MRRASFVIKRGWWRARRAVATVWLFDREDLELVARALFLGLAFVYVMAVIGVGAGIGLHLFRWAGLGEW